MKIIISSSLDIHLQETKSIKMNLKNFFSLTVHYNIRTGPSTGIQVCMVQENKPADVEGFGPEVTLATDTLFPSSSIN